VRIAVVIVALAAVAVALVQVRRREITVRHEIQRLQTQQVSLRRTLWDQQARLGYLTAPKEIRRRMAEVSKSPSSSEHLAQGKAAEKAPLRD